MQHNAKAEGAKMGAKYSPFFHFCKHSIKLFWND